MNRRTGIILLMVILYFANFQLCWLIYPEDVDAWYTLKGAIYNMVIALGVYLASLNTKSKTNIIILTIFNGLVINNIIDRLVFNSVKYEWEDILVIALVISVTYFEYKWRTKNKQQQTGQY